MHACPMPKPDVVLCMVPTAFWIWMQPRKRTWGPESGYTVDLSRARTNARSPDSESTVLSAVPHLWAITSLSSSSHREGGGCLITAEGKVLTRWSPSSLRTRPGSVGGPGSRWGLKLSLTTAEGAQARSGPCGRMETVCLLTWGSLGSKGLHLWFRADLGLSTTSTNCVTLGKSHSSSEPWFPCLQNRDNNDTNS